MINEATNTDLPAQIMEKMTASLRDMTERAKTLRANMPDEDVLDMMDDRELENLAELVNDADKLITLFRSEG